MITEKEETIMSKIVILSAKLASPQINNDLLSKVIAQHPEIADFFKDWDPVPLIKECADKALNRLSRQDGITKDSRIEDYYGNSTDKHNNQQILGALKTSALPKGLGIIVDQHGKIIFAGDNYQSSWKQEISRLQKLFNDAYIAEFARAVLQIIGYEVSEIEQSCDCCHFEGVKQ